MIPSSTCPSWQHDIPAHPNILVALISYTTGGDTIHSASDFQRLTKHEAGVGAAILRPTPEFATSPSVAA